LRNSVIQARRGAKAAKIGADAAKAGAEATRQSVEMLMSKERARLRVDIAPFELKKEFGVYRVNFTVSNPGPTAAFIVETGCVTYYLPPSLIASENAGSAAIFPLSTLPSVISPNSPPIQQYAFLFITDEWLIPEIKKGTFFVGMRGFIKYRDVFDRDRETRFRYVWKYLTMYGLGEEYGNWEKCGTEAENQAT